MVFVRCEQYEDVSRALVGRELHPFHIVITESLEYLLDEILESFPSRRRPRERRNARITISEPPGNTGASEHDGQGADDASARASDDWEGYEVCRTFICEAPVLMGSRTVVQSTTEAVTIEDASSSAAANYQSHFRGVNPRRFV